MKTIFASFFLPAAIVSLNIGSVALGSVKSASTDGEATVYLTGNFSQAFDVAYRAELRPGTQNKSWSSLSILLIGNKIPGPGVSVGIAGDPKTRSVTPFTYSVFPGQKYEYKKQLLNCSAGCVMEVRGDATHIFAYVDNKLVERWSRSDLYLHQPSIQLNAEAHGTGDTIEATLVPIRSIAAGRVVRPTCAFTTRGIEPAGVSNLTFHGRTSDAAGAFVTLSTGMHGDKC